MTNLKSPECQSAARRYLTLEVFTATASFNHDTLADYRASVQYWRQFIPHEGMRLGVQINVRRRPREKIIQQAIAESEMTKEEAESWADAFI